ncbi:response regulator transcription factor [Solirubrobacter sp. CPCC 204708]|uniref:Response regulator transcription factor n=1 Tax=Solirubrobacter deserti TaxID=2282478 RepID=A0ABT4RE12_9ACTN|nr:response regulator transcription factor [Solirubrobacter deserti]MBE2316008.1 response regulator transcription factor [Solirubrobacter deserti]MDA0136760.1 response regulator transcription factor [Solirubrobacter deserti]
MARLLVAEDEDTTRLSLTHVLRREGYEVDEARDGLEAERLGVGGDHALVILDVEMPGLDGLEVCRRIRAVRPTVPIMMLTGRGDEADAVNGFDAGADDYVAKPFRLQELLARVRANVRRSAPDLLSAGDVRIDKLARRAWHGAQELQLSPREFDLLTFLVANAGRTVTREEVMNTVWEGEWQGSNKTLDMNVVALRRKLGDDARAPTHLVTVRGVGLRFESS